MTEDDDQPKFGEEMLSEENFEQHRNAIVEYETIGEEVMQQQRLNVRLYLRSNFLEITFTVIF
jgi:hypothetical protein